MFYDRFMELCKEQDKSAAAVVRDIGLNNSASTTWKRGSIPKGETLKKLANYFGVSVDYLLGTGPRINPLSSSRRIFSIMNEKRISLEEMSQRTDIPLETIRSFALGEKVDNGRHCIEEIAEKLGEPPAYLLGWTNHPKDEGDYWDISEDYWISFNNDPDSAHGAHQAFEPDNVDYELVWDTLTDVGFTIKSAGIGDGHGPGGDMYYLWHEDAEYPEEERVRLPFREMLRIVEAVQKDAERHRKDYLRKRFDAEWF